MKLTSLALASVIVLGAGAAANAQPAPPPGPNGAAPAARQWQRPDPAQMAERHAQRLRDTLQLRPDQEPALRAFLAAAHPARDNPRGPGARPGVRGERQALTTPQRLDQMSARLAQRQARFQQTAEATKRFYAQLSPTQQKAFDTLHQGRGGHDRGGKGGRGGHDRGGFGHRMG